MSLSIKAHSSKSPKYYLVTKSDVISQPRTSRSHKVSEHYHLSPAKKQKLSENKIPLEEEFAALIIKSHNVKYTVKHSPSSSSNEEDFSDIWGKDKRNTDSVLPSPKTASYDLGTSSLATNSTSVVYILVIAQI